MFYWFVYHFVARIVLLPFLKLFNRMEISGTEHIPRTGPAIIIGNHISLWDAVILFCIVDRKIWFIGKEELFRVPLLGPILRLVGVFPVKRDRIDREALRKSAEVLEQGDILSIYPEGTRSTSGELLPFKNGAALFAHRSGAAVIPVYSENTNRIFPKSLGRRVRITVGSALDLSEYYGKKANQSLLEEMSGRYREAILDLAGREP